MNKLSILLIIIAIGSVISVKSTNGINTSNSEASILCNAPHASNYQSPLPPQQKNVIKLCPSCKSTTHFNIENQACPNNPNKQSGPQCKFCKLFGHTKRNSPFCNKNPNKDKERDMERVCTACNGNDHVDIKSNLCARNKNSFKNNPIICGHCNLPGHKLTRSIHCLQNPLRLAREAATTARNTEVFIINDTSYCTNSETTTSNQLKNTETIYAINPHNNINININNSNSNKTPIVIDEESRDSGIGNDSPNDSDNFTHTPRTNYFTPEQQTAHKENRNNRMRIHRNNQRNRSLNAQMLRMVINNHISFD
jgi:hypothetical protein